MERSYFTEASQPPLSMRQTPLAKIFTRRLTAYPAEITATTIHNAFSPREFSPERRRTMRMEARAEFGYGTSDVVGLIAANGQPSCKGFDVPVEAQALLADSRC